MTLGATDVVVEEFEVSLELFAKALDSYEIPINRIWREVESVRTEALRAAAWDGGTRPQTGRPETPHRVSRQATNPVPSQSSKPLFTHESVDDLRY